MRLRLILSTAPLPNLSVAPVESLVPLRRLAPGQSARIGRIVGPPDHVRRLREFGLHNGTQIEMFRSGNPCIFRMAGNKVCFRADEFLDVLVLPGGTPC